MKINGVILIDEPMEKDTDYSIALEQVAVKRIETKDISDCDDIYITHIVENFGRVNILKEKDGKPHLIKGKAKTCSKSQVMRLQIESEGLDYDNVMNILLKDNKWKELV